MKNLSFKWKNVRQPYASAGVRQVSSILITLVSSLLLVSCEKDDEQAKEEFVKAETGIRLVHSSYQSRISGIDLYIDDVKITGSEAVAFSAASGYFPIATGSKRIAVKTTSGIAIADTTVNITDGRQYSFFVKDRSIVNEALTGIIELKDGLIPVINNNTSAPADGTAKVRFVNMSSEPLNDAEGHISFLTVNPPGNPATTVITQTLGQDKLTFSSDYSSFEAGPITFRAQSVNAFVVDLQTTLEAGKLYTVYVTSTEHLVKTPTKSPLSLKIISN